MNARVKKLADEFIGAAKKNPKHAPKIFRKAASVFIGLANDPRNQHVSKELQEVAFDFVGAAAAKKRGIEREEEITVQDFTDLLRETALAYEQTNDDPLDQISRRREIHDERTVIPPGHTSIAPASFNADATLGRSAVIKYNPTPEDVSNGIAQSQTVAFWQGVKKEAQAITVDCALAAPPPPGVADDAASAPTSVRPYGVVEYGSDGNRTSVAFDIGQGKRFTVVGNYVSVLVGADPPALDSLAALSPTTQISVGASIGTFAAPSQASITRTLYIDRLAGETDLLPIPIKATKLLSVQSDHVLGGQADINFFAYGGGLNPITRAFYIQSDTAPFPPLDLYGDESFVKVVNASGTRNFRLVFQLSM